MKFKELKNKSSLELNKMLGEYRAKLRDLKFKVASKQLKNIREIRQVKKIIAQILTLMKQHHLTQFQGQAKKDFDDVNKKDK